MTELSVQRPDPGEVTPVTRRQVLKRAGGAVLALATPAAGTATCAMSTPASTPEPTSPGGAESPHLTALDAFGRRLAREYRRRLGIVGGATVHDARALAALPELRLQVTSIGELTEAYLLRLPGGSFLVTLPAPTDTRPVSPEEEAVWILWAVVSLRLEPPCESLATMRRDPKGWQERDAARAARAKEALAGFLSAWNGSLPELPRGLEDGAFAAVHVEAREAFEAGHASRRRLGVYGYPTAADSERLAAEAGMTLPEAGAEEDRAREAAGAVAALLCAGDGGENRLRRYLRTCFRAGWEGVLPGENRPA